MENLDQFQNILQELKKKSESIIRLSLPLLKKMADDKTFIYDKIKSKYPSYDDKEIKLKMKNMSSELINDAQSIKKELPEFVDYILAKSSKNTKSFLYQVWSGDVYGERGINGLKELLTDLDEQLKNCNENNLIEKI